MYFPPAEKRNPVKDIPCYPLSEITAKQRTHICSVEPMAQRYFSRHLYQLLSSEEKQELDPSKSRQEDLEANQTADKATTEPSSSPAQASVWKSTLNLVNYIEGVGFLALPYAVYRGGIFTIVAFLVVPLISWYVCKVLIDCLYERQSDIKIGEKDRRTRVRSTYGEIGEACWPRFGGPLVNIALVTTLFTVPVTYLVLCGSLMSHTFPSLPLTEVMWTCLAAAVVFPTTFLKSLSHIAWLSLLGVVALSGTFFVVMWEGAKQSPSWDFSSLFFWDTEGAGVALGIVVFGYGAFEIVISVEDSMADKTKFGCAQSLAYVISAIYKVAFALTSYFLFYVDGIQEVILNNIPPGPLLITVSVVFVLSVLVTYAIPLHTIFLCLEDSFLANAVKCRSSSLVWFVLVRIVLAFFILLVVGFFRRFAILAAVTGSLIEPLAGFILPCIFQLKLKWQELSLFEIAMDCLFILFGVFLLIMGSIFAITDLFK